MNGLCLSGEVCVSGTCYQADSTPNVCASGVNGVCNDPNNACVNGSCQTITASNQCSPSDANGLCPGGEVCIEGYCYSAAGITCSTTQPDGYCPQGQTCNVNLGICQALPNTGLCSSSDYQGLCSAWEVCAEGTCVGPVPPGALGCSVQNGSNPYNNSGICPATETCVAGVCVLPYSSTTTTNVCSTTNTTGLCFENAGCNNGRCVAITTANACSTSQPSGLCTGGAVCVNGTCKQSSCGQTGGLQCAQGTWCSGGECIPLPCDPVHPGGLCADSTEVCVDGLCLPPSCSAANPNGTCQLPESCVSGQCVMPPCSNEYPTGSCSDPTTSCGEVTISSVCASDANCLFCQSSEEVNCFACQRKACSAQVTNGYCTSNATVHDPNYNLVPIAAVCCDSTLSSETGCNVGTCTAPACSASSPHGACLNIQTDYCSNGNCVAAPCSAGFTGGYCANSNDVCVAGQCSLTNCLAAPDPNAFCAPYVCSPYSQNSAYNGVCVQPACGVDPNNGYCPVGKACCNATIQGSGDPNCTNPSEYGTCISPVCSAYFPGGSCPSNDICTNILQNGNTVIECIEPPCSSAHPNGNCGNPNFECALNPNTQKYQCALQPCSPTALAGFCPSATVGSQTVPSLCYAANGNTLDPNYGTCQIEACSDYFPTAACITPGYSCVQQSGHYTCVQPACDPNHLGGSCPPGEICIGSCVQPACDVSNPNGACPSQQICCNSTLSGARGCTLGTCAERPCGDASQNANFNGYCPPESVCCTGTLEAESYALCTGGNEGSCVAEQCSTLFPGAPCPVTGQVCYNGTCYTPCSTTARMGWCPPPNATVTNGYACVEGKCSVACPGDQDCDNIPDSIEGLNPNTNDFDGDGSPNGLDHDSDYPLAVMIPDDVESLCSSTLPATDCTPVKTTPGQYDFLNYDSDGDFITDVFEAGPVKSHPQVSFPTTQNPNLADYRNPDSDHDGVLDKCEASDTYTSWSGQIGNCAANQNTTAPVYQTPVATHNGVYDYLSLDSDGDGISDTIENSGVADANGVVTLLSAGTIYDHDGDHIPDIRDTDSDNDSVLDSDEDVNFNGVCDCQLDPNGNYVTDPRGAPYFPTCGEPNYEFNPGCIKNGTKCLLAETSRIHPDTNLNGIPDNQDAIYLVCGAKNLKPINVFYNEDADYAFALEPNYTKTFIITGNVGQQIGFAFDDLDNTAATINGSYSVSGALTSKPPAGAATGDTNATLVQKAVVQAQIDGSALATANDSTFAVTSVSSIISSNFTSFDGFGAVVSRYQVNTNNSVSINELRDAVVTAVVGTNNLGGTGTFTTGITSGPADTSFTVTIETLYRYDSGSNTGRVMNVIAVVRTGASQNDMMSYAYRDNCPAVSNSTTCGQTEGCTWTGSCVERTNYQLPLFFSDNITNGSALTQYGNGLASLCQSMIQQNGILDFLWVVDNSISMAPKIGQVVSASNTFFNLLNSSEADYRVALVSTAPSLDSSTPASIPDPALNVFKPEFPGCVGLPQVLCETTTTSGGCTWDYTNSQCSPICTPFTTQGACLRSGCSWDGTAGACYWGGCSSLNTYPAAANSLCGGQTTQSGCNTAGCVWDTNSTTCLAQDCLACNNNPDSGSCAAAGCTWNSSAPPPCVSSASAASICNAVPIGSCPGTESSSAPCYYNGGQCSPALPYCTALGQSACTADANCTWRGVQPQCAPNQSWCQSNRCFWDGANCDTFTNQLMCNGQMLCAWSSVSNTCNLSSLSDRSNGALLGDFTGTIAGNTSTIPADRSAGYSCDQGCAIDETGATVKCANLARANCENYPQCTLNSANQCVSQCCSRCVNSPTDTTVKTDPSCYFASRLPPDNGNGFEYGLLMAQWAMYRGGATFVDCVGATQAQCSALPSCQWLSSSGGACVPGYCNMSFLSSAPNTSDADTAHQSDPLEQCNGNNPNYAGSPNDAAYGYNGPQLTQINQAFTPHGQDYPHDELAPAGCEYSSEFLTCVPAPPTPCGEHTTQPSCALFAPNCKWTSANVCVPDLTASPVLCGAAANATACAAQGPGFCQYDACSNFTASGSSICNAVTGCLWSGSSCTGGNVCHPPLARQFRNNATKVAVILSDEEECYVKDGNYGVTGTATQYNGACEFYQYDGGLMLYNDPVRIARTNAYMNNFIAHGFTAYALVGDKANAAVSSPTTRAGFTGTPGQGTCPAGCVYQATNPNVSDPSDSSDTEVLQARCINPTTNTLCSSNSAVLNGGCYNPITNGPLVQAEAGQAYINVAEGTGGGWGSICASNLYPSIEATVVQSISAASPYKLYGSVNGQEVQAISASISVAVQTCVNPNNYTLNPNLCSPQGSNYVQILHRSRTNGFDYDATNNSIVLYGNARAIPNGDIVVSYRYFVKNVNNGGQGDTTCPCPSTDPNSCQCPSGDACGTSTLGATDGCLKYTEVQCATAAGCSWNSAGITNASGGAINGGFCETTGLCGPDPTCGGKCTGGLKCNATTGLCECDLSCGTGCSAGKTCDNDSLNACTSFGSSQCATHSQCATNPSTGACESATCGTCVCDPTCGGGCAAGQTCNTSGANCGLCTCETNCGGTCTSNQSCDGDPNSPTCGLCLAKTCPANCPAGEVCDPTTGNCVCDPTCGGGCTAGELCDSTPGANCGTCVCDTTCGGLTPPAGQKCDSNPNDATCGHFIVDPTCGGEACHANCTYPTQVACGQDANCVWKSYVGSGTCEPVVCGACDVTSGTCTIDELCSSCGGCSNHTKCDANSGSCVCDTTCGGTCSLGEKCDTNSSSLTCGQCICDTTCGGSCPAGDVCDTGSLSPTCGQCIVDPTCGGQCVYPTQCNSSTGLCQSPACVCQSGFVCDPLTLRCIGSGG